VAARSATETPEPIWSTSRSAQIKAVTVFDAVAWLLRQPEDTITVQELLDLCRTARR
jgi:hypothetical protein